MKRYGTCENVGPCSKAGKNPPVIQCVDDESAQFICSECDEPLKEIEEKRSSDEPTNDTRRKKRLLTFGVLTVFLLACVGIGSYFLLENKSKSPKLIMLDKQSSELEVGGMETLKAIVEPEDVKTAFTWVSSDTMVVKVVDGMVAAVAPGSASVSVRVTGKETLSASCLYTVKAKEMDSPSPHTDSAMSALSSGHVEEENGTGSISTPFGKYKGDLKGGKANGNGTFQFFKTCRISVKDNQKRIAEAEDYITGQFVDNEITQVKWFDKSGTQKGVIIIGKTGL